jgi:hypothetical protein
VFLLLITSSLPVVEAAVLLTLAVAVAALVGLGLALDLQ